MLEKVYNKNMSEHTPEVTNHDEEYTKKWEKKFDELDSKLESILSKNDKDTVEKLLRENLSKEDENDLTPEEVKKFLDALKKMVSSADVLTMSDEEREDVLELIDELRKEQSSSEDGEHDHHGHGHDHGETASQKVAGAMIVSGGLFTGLIGIFANNLWNTIRGKEGGGKSSGGGGGHGGGGHGGGGGHH